MAVIAISQLIVVLDDTIANIALPTLQNDLGISAASLPWVVNAYILAFGGLLLFGGRLGDLYGRRRMLQVGMAVFTVASLLVGDALVHGYGLGLVAASAALIAAAILVAFLVNARKGEVTATEAALH